jgi:hypothetical protein
MLKPISIPITAPTPPQEITALFMGCNIDRQLWTPVRKMIWDGEIYRTSYINGVRTAMESDLTWHTLFSLSPLDRIHVSHQVPSMYGRRMSLDRPLEMEWYAPYLGLSADNIDPIAHVARTGGYRASDRLDIFPEVQPDADGSYRFYFGLQELYLPDVYEYLTSSILVGDAIVSKDGEAIHQGVEIGYLPGYIRAHCQSYPERVEIRVERVNPEAFYTSDKLLCMARCQGFVPFASQEYQPIGNLYA